jgi:GT2 family glycosyltransferase
VPESVAAVVVTYNRSRLLLECLDALLRQTMPLTRIILVDNASSDGTQEALEAAGYLRHPAMDFIRLPKNTGGAGGFHEGIKRAMAVGVDWMWIMDDDAEPYPDALEKMAPAFGRSGIGGVANLTLGLDGLPQLEHRGWLRLCGMTPRAHRAIDGSRLEEETEISFASFVGLAVHRSAVERIGLPKRELFIKGDDLDYCIRLAQLGPIILVPTSKIRHKDGVAAGYQARRRFGMTSARVPLDKLWLNYFSLRNLIWMRRQHCGRLPAFLYSLRQYLRAALGILVFDSERSVRLRFYYCAIADAWRGSFDNERPKRLTAAR